MAIAFTFPGQGSQAVGMGRDLAGNFAPARAVFEEVDAALGEKLSRVIFEGPEAELTLTANAQPALMAMSLAVLRVLEAEAGLDLARQGAFVAGHSLGEYSALCAAGSLGLADTARLLRLRGTAMQAAVAPGEGAMAALLGVELPDATAIAAQAAQVGVCQVANDNGAGQIVVSGERAAVEHAIEIARAHGVKRAVPLAVSAPFHCALMEPAARAMAQALAEVEISAPRPALIANVTAAPIARAREIAPALTAQVTGTVRWRESVAFMAGQGVSVFYEIGAGKVLTGLAKRIAAQADAIAIGSVADVAAFVAGRRG